MRSYRVAAVAACRPRSVKPALVTNQTIEPTQVAGFNQFYDDFNATKAWLFGIGLDTRATDSLYAGAELTYRELDELFARRGKEFTADADEKSARVYLYWTPLDQLAITSGATFNVIDFEALLLRTALRLHGPASVNYFHPSGFFASAGPTYVWQDVKTGNGKAIRSFFTTGG